MKKEIENISTIHLPSNNFGISNKHRTMQLDLKCQNIFYQIGKIWFGRDHSIYFSFKEKIFLLEMGDAVIKDGSFRTTSYEDLSQIPISQRNNIHLSLHPSGEIHLKSDGQKPVTKMNIGKWFPVKKEFIFAHIYTCRIRDLKVIKTSKNPWEVYDPDTAIRLDFVIKPLGQKDGKYFYTYDTTTIWQGMDSPNYGICLNLTPVTPPKDNGSMIYFPYTI
jgi:hypothetical protein